MAELEVEVIYSVEQVSAITNYKKHFIFVVVKTPLLSIIHVENMVVG